MPKGIKGFSKGNKLGQKFWKGHPQFNTGKTRFKKGYKQSDTQKENISRALRGKQNSLGYKFPLEARERISERMKGKNNPNWKGGISSLHLEYRHSLEYEIWRREVYKKDNWVCRICGKKCSKKDIVAHHLKLFSEVPELRFSVDNGITLCRNCHSIIHKLGRKKIQ